MILRWSQTNLGSLYTMVPSKRSKNEVYDHFIELVVCWKWGH